MIRDRPALTGTDITNPEQSTDPTTSQPNITFDFTDEGQAKFEAVTRRIAQRAGERATGRHRRRGRPVLRQLRDRARRRRRVAPIVNFAENPNGIDGRTGAQISGLNSLGEAQDLAETLRIGALPIELKLISQSTVSATLGQQALTRACRRPVGLALVVLFLLAYYRFLGFVAALGPRRVRAVLPRADQADPDHASPCPGSRG